MMSSKSHTLPPPVNHHKDCMSAATKCYKYLRRIFKFDQMDFEFAMWQMLYLFISPQKVYRNFQYRKQTKLQFARDDPAFLVLFAASLCVTSIGFALVLGFHFIQFLNFLLYVVFVDCIGAGIIVATMFWYILNRYFRMNQHDQDVEWGYAFDIHLNAFFPPLIILHFCQLFFYSLLSHHGLPSRFLGNTFWLIAVFYYIYITFLGYSCLQFVHRTHYILFSLPVVFILYVSSLVGGLNITLCLINFYKERVV